MCFFLIFCALLQITATRRVVTTNKGLVEGVLYKHPLAYSNSIFSNYYGFTGIPYAKPPLGNLRFKAPQELDPWDGVLNATKEPPVCMQRNYLFNEDPPIEGQEDCLYLNVYVPEIQCSFKGFPVMVFIHWGAFIAGRSTADYLGPTYFMEKQVILVTFNYRLGPFGFLSTTNDEAPGNYGLKDQVAVLKWVQANIEKFGGDKDCVTIFGQSAGAGSVHYHLLSPMSRGLFHRAISQSGNALAPWAFPSNALQEQITMIQARLVGCGRYTLDSPRMVSCLRQIPAEDIMKSQSVFRSFYGNPMAIYGPVTETTSMANEHAFLTKTPLQYILGGEITSVPWLTGIVKNEGNVRAPSLIRSCEERTALNRNFEKTLTEPLMLFSLSTSKPQELYNNVSKFYFNGKESIDIDDKATIKGLVDLFSDRAFIYPLYQALHFHTRMGHSPIYVYNFEYEGSASYEDHFACTTEKIDYDWGTCHCDELLYLFDSPSLFPQLKLRSSDRILKDFLVSLWVKFATEGEMPSTLIPKWNPLRVGPAGKLENIEFYNISGSVQNRFKLQVSNNLYSERMKFWSDADIYENKPNLMSVF